MSVELTPALIKSAFATDKRVELWDAQVTGLSLRVSPTGKKSWMLFYRHDARQRVMKLGSFPIMSLAEARKLAGKLLLQVMNGGDPAGEKDARRAAASFADLANDYLTRHASQKKSGHEDERIVRSELLPAWGSRKAADITRREVIALLDAIVDRGSPVMANRVQALISGIFNYGIDRALVEFSPTHNLKRQGGKESPRERVLLPEELRAVWLALDEEPDRISAIVKLLILTGARKTEVTNIEWSEVDLDAGWWTLPKERSKNARAHRIPLTAQSLEILGGMKGQDARAQVFREGKFAGKMGLDPYLASIRERSAVKDFTLHDLRRTFTSRLAALEVSQFVLDKLLNHADPSMTGRHYNLHSYDQEKRRELTKWDRWLAELVADRPHLRAAS